MDSDFAIETSSCLLYSHQKAVTAYFSSKQSLPFGSSAQAFFVIIIILLSQVYQISLSDDDDVNRGHRYGELCALRSGVCLIDGKPTFDAFMQDECLQNSSFPSIQVRSLYIASHPIKFLNTLKIKYRQTISELTY